MTKTASDERLCQPEGFIAITAQRHTVKHLSQYIKTDFKPRPFLTHSRGSAPHSRYKTACHSTRLSF